MTPPPSMQRGADFSPCGRYRYRLWRQWGEGSRVVFVGLNPSTADASRDDPTIRRCIGFAQRWGHARFDIVNLFAFRATQPVDLRAALEPEGPDNLKAIRHAVNVSSAVIACWGHMGGWRDQDRRVLPLLPDDTRCLGTTKGGHPRHPLFVRYGTPLVPLPLSPAGPPRTTGG